MFPTIHKSSAQDLNTQGYGALSDCLSCEVTEELNGAFTLEMTYPLKGLHSEFLIPGNIIEAVPNHKQKRQPFRISQVRKSFANNAKVYANHISYDLNGYPVKAANTYNSLDATFLAMNAMTWTTGSADYHQFTFGKDFNSSARFSMPAIQTLRSWMGGQEGSIIDVYGGEWVYDDYSCFLTSRRGQDTGYRISYGKNLAEYETQGDYTAYSHVCAFWKKSNVTVSGGLVSTGIEGPFRVAYVDASNAYETQPTTTTLDAFATAYIQKTNFGVQSITITPAQIGNDNIGLGDSVLICYETVFSTRVVKTVWDVLAGAYTKMELGSKKVSIAETIKSLVK